MTSVTAARTEAGEFSHEALLYRGEREFVDGTVSFLRDGIAAQEPTLVVVGAEKIERLRAELGPDRDRVQFADMAEVGANPARIIPAWERFVSDHARPGRGLRGIGEPIWAGRTPAELVECQRHEALLNLAFADTPNFRLLCPYDTRALGGDVIEESHRSHALIAEGGRRRGSVALRDLGEVAAPFDLPLPEPVAAEEMPVLPGSLVAVRRFVADRATAAGVPAHRVADLVLAVNELATNSLRHAGGNGTLRIWTEPYTMLCEVRDRGLIADPLIGRRRPPRGQEGGRGLWLANQLCDLVQVRSGPNGSVVRLHLRRA
ncbi:MAG TPA: sensor histidine kinase [Mycobacteriales bacterium]|nr:sensor histidine kinase [Mycobacteriales bacterium]